MRTRSRTRGHLYLKIDTSCGAFLEKVGMSLPRRVGRIRQSGGPVSVDVTARSGGCYVSPFVDVAVPVAMARGLGVRSTGVEAGEAASVPIVHATLAAFHSSTVHGPKCAVCGVACTPRCRGCGLRYYCSRVHQKADWSAHKLVCSPPT